ncbi:ferredoxin [Streptomyces sp. H39-S7]|uniref:ferredoxin n=1 Tax=Streptomyces sp. H39-S7 TaxID=3004357 RepID=UPI0022AFEFDE|nr:ferredoxin [Streptomyces sp. H39-S7]MCZ4119519.1 ferredoxin [Streptomyces sp. H39-S7]
MRVSVDSERCVGAALCTMTAPSVFEQDDEGVSAVIAGSEDGAGDPRVHEAVRVCPVQAISVAVE